VARGANTPCIALRAQPLGNAAFYDLSEHGHGLSAADEVAVGEDEGGHTAEALMLCPSLIGQHGFEVLGAIQRGVESDRLEPDFTRDLTQDGAFADVAPLLPIRRKRPCCQYAANTAR